MTDWLVYALTVSYLEFRYIPQVCFLFLLMLLLTIPTILLKRRLRKEFDADTMRYHQKCELLTLTLKRKSALPISRTSIGIAVSLLLTIILACFLESEPPRGKLFREGRWKPLVAEFGTQRRILPDFLAPPRVCGAMAVRANDSRAEHQAASSQIPTTQLVIWIRHHTRRSLLME